MAQTADNIVPFIRLSKQQKRIIELINKFEIVVPDYILRDFDANEFDNWAANTPISNGEKIIAQFVLGVWDRYTEFKVGKFDLFNAANKLDNQNWEIIVNWCKKPFFL